MLLCFLSGHQLSRLTQCFSRCRGPRAAARRPVLPQRARALTAFGRLRRPSPPLYVPPHLCMCRQAPRLTLPGPAAVLDHQAAVARLIRLSLLVDVLAPRHLAPSLAGQRVRRIVVEQQEARAVRGGGGAARGLAAGGERPFRSNVASDRLHRRTNRTQKGSCRPYPAHTLRRARDFRRPQQPPLGPLPLVLPHPHSADNAALAQALEARFPPPSPVPPHALDAPTSSSTQPPPHNLHRRRALPPPPAALGKARPVPHALGLPSRSARSVHAPRSALVRLVGQLVLVLVAQSCADRVARGGFEGSGEGQGGGEGAGEEVEAPCR
ncbi:hypothetical protein DMC30DRAFT_386311 [Rhodotorula diobovata]|uniref:Uncharacterized protein n=1 Tax=Rhodotorula diobovata TaxID=5288 RepID=A0A5C5G6K4_9BASI|nr:hypothetical protein DMC30DRAFT_386311 [Rhodotorula diobovata]